METDNNALMLIDNHGSFEMDDPADMDVDGNDNNAMTVFTPATPVADADNGALLDPDTLPNKRRRKKSIVWEHFTIETVSPGSTKACCKHCKKSFAYITGSKLAGTSHLKRHIALGICPVSRQNSQQLTQTPETKSHSSTGPPKKRFRSSPGYMNIPLDQDRCYHEMAKMIIMHEYPLHMVEHPGFAGFVQTLQPQFNMASFNTIHGDCVSMYLLEKQKLSEFIRGIPSRVNLTLDLWTSNQSLGYAFMTGHFIDNDWNLHRRLLNVLIVPSPDSDFAFNQSVAACLSDWNLERKLSSLTVDQSIANKTAIENLRGFLSLRNPHVLDGQLLIGTCYARLLSSMARDALGSEELEIPIKKVRDSVKYVKTNDSHEDRFYEVKRQLRIPSTKDIFIDDQTKWNTTYNMLVAACEHKEVFSCLETCDPDYKMAPSFEEWKKTEILCTCLKLLFDAANVLTGPTHPTANTLYHEVTKLQLELTHAAMSEDPEVSNLANPLREKFDVYWRDRFLVLAVAVVMDPRFKMKLIEFSFSKIYGEDAGKWIKTVDDGIHDLYLDYAAQHFTLLDAYVEHGNNGISETEMSQEVHFHQELPHEHHHTNGVSQDHASNMFPQEVNPLYEQPKPSDSEPHYVLPQNGHPQKGQPSNGQSQEGHPPDDKPQEGHGLVVHQHPSHEPQEAHTSDAQPEGGQRADTPPQEGHLADALPREDQQAEALPEEGQPGEMLPQESQTMEGLSQEGQPTETRSQGDQPMEGLSQEGKSADATVPPEHLSVEGLPQESQPMGEGLTEESQLTEGLTQENQQGEGQPVLVQETQLTEGPAQEGQPVEGMPQETQPVEGPTPDSQLMEGMPQETQPVEVTTPDSQPVEGMPQETQPMEGTTPDGQPVEGMPMPWESQPVGGIPPDSQPLEDMLEENHTAEGFSQEGQSMESLPQEPQNAGGIPQEPQNAEGLYQEPQSAEGMPQEPENAEGLHQEPQRAEGMPQEPENAEGMPQEPENAEGLPQKTQNAEGLPQEPPPTEGLPQPSSEGLPTEVQHGEVQVLNQDHHPSDGLPEEGHHSHSVPHEDHHSFGLSQEGHHVDVLLQEGHHLEASSQDFPLITIGDGFSDFELYISEISSHQQMKSELDQYLEESLMPRSQDFDILGWWKLNRTKYPILSKMAADILSVPFATLTPDSVFDTKMKKMDDYRSSLRPVTLEALICAKDWFQYGSSTPENHSANMQTES